VTAVTAASAPSSPSLAERRRVARLFRRAGFGATTTEIDTWARRGYGAAVDSLLAFTPASGRPDNAELHAMIALAAAVDAEGLQLPDITIFQRWWLDRMATTRYPLEEKLTLHWHGHLASGYQKVALVAPMLRQNKLLREMAGGDFRALCDAITADPAMLIYLDGAQNQVNGINENYGREFMELFTLGRNNGYTQRDVVAAARCFTGYTVDPTTYAATFQPTLHDAGLKTLLGNTGNWGPRDVTDIVLDRHPGGHVAATHVARRVASTIAAPPPSASMVASMAAAFVGTNYQIKPMVRAMLLHHDFTDGPLGIASPVEFVASMMRALGLGRTKAAGDYAQSYAGMAQDELAIATLSMGQGLFMPPDVSGWKGGAAWANTATFLTRYNFAARAAQLVASDLVSQVLDNSIGSPDAMPEHWMAMLGLLEISADTRAGIEQYRAAAKAAGNAANATARGVLTLLLASPDYAVR